MHVGFYMANVLRDEVNGKVIITYPNKTLEGTFLTSVDLITDSGLFRIDLRHSVGFESAKKRHKAMIARHQPQEPHACVRCGKKDYLPTWSRVFQEWLCPSCLDVKLEACR